MFGTGKNHTDTPPPAPPAPFELTLATAPTDGKQRRFFILLCLGLALVSTALLPFASRPWAEIPQFVPFYIAGVILTDAITAFLLFSQFYQSRSGSLLVLAGAYLFTGTIVIPHLLWFPGLTPSGLVFGSSQTSAWMWHFWHLGFPTIVLGYVLISRFRPHWVVKPGSQGLAIAATCASVLALNGLLTGLAAWPDLLPVLHDGRNWNRLTFDLGWVMGGVTATAFVLLWAFHRGRSILHLWLAVALVAFFFDFTPNLLALSRYSVGWYLGRLNGLISAGFLLAMFLWETNRLYADLGGALRRLKTRTRDLDETNARLRTALAEKQMLLKEVNHRVKNNLQIVSGLLAMEALRAQEGAEGGYRRSMARIESMALVHELLYRTERFDRIDLADYIGRLCEGLVGPDGPVWLRMHMETVFCDTDRAVNIGMIVNEVVCNALKHAFPVGRMGEIGVGLRFGTDNRLILSISDNGVGMSGTRPSSGGSLGMEVIEALAEQLGGRAVFATGNGTHFSLALPGTDYTAQDNALPAMLPSHDANLRAPEDTAAAG